MYNYRRHKFRRSVRGSHSFGQPQNGQNGQLYQNGNRSNQQTRNRRKADKKIDPNLFIKPASMQTQTDFVSQHTFNDYAIADQIKRNIANHGYHRPTQIQEKAIPHLLERRDTIGMANTGTGKTAAFLIPLIEKVNKNRNERILIMAPTRELAMQILDEFTLFAAGLGLHATLCIGGASMNRQEEHLRRNPQFVIGTPGRLKDLVNQNKLRLHVFHTIVLDEVDRMVDIGFIHDIKFIMSHLPEQRHSVFFSATVSKDVADILHTFAKDPVTVSVVQQPTSDNVDQDVIRIANPSEKLEKLEALLHSEGFDKVLVFGRTKWGVEKLAKTLVKHGFRAAAIHGNKSQGQRQRALDEFKKNRIQVLLATDVASRGLDIDDVTHVINYDQPQSYEDYIHRIGRTGRAAKKGVALTFVDSSA